MYNVRPDDSPMRIARKLTGNAQRYGELLAANPHKPIVYVGARPTFASLGVGERLNVPATFGIGALPSFGALPSVDPEVAAKLEAYRTGTPEYKKQVEERWRKRRKSPGPFDFITDPLVAVVEDIGEAISSIPVVGDVTRIVSDTYTAPLRLARDIASGARIDQAVLKAAKDQVRTVRDAAPYAQIVISVVPGIGTGVSAAMSAGLALAEGRDIDEIAKAAIRGALPGGPLAAAGFDAALKVAQGQNIGKVALEGARELIPPGVGRQAFDIGLAVATGENIQNALAGGLAQMGADQMRTIASDWLKTASPAVVSAVAAMPEEVARGSTLAMGILSQEGINPKALRAVRQKLSGKALEGFDSAVKSVEARMPGITAALSPPSAPPPTRKPPTLRTELSPKRREELRQLEQLAKLSPKEQEELRQLAALKKLSPKEQEDLRQLAALKKLPPEQQKALAALDPEEREQLRKIAKLSPKEQEALRKRAAAPPPPPPAAVVAPPAPAALRAFQYGPYPQA